MTIALPGTVAVVTGAAGGIGREICKALRAAGAQVLATDLPGEAPGIDADLYLQHDVTSPEGWQRIAATVHERHGRLDILVNAAAISIVASIENTPLSEWHRVNAVNVDSIIIGTQTLLEFGALGYNIRVNSVHPGGIDTAMLASIMDRYVEIGAVPSRDAAMAGIIASHPIGRMGRPDELGGGVVFLCSDAASFVTCSELNIDGGFTAV